MICLYVFWALLKGKLFGSADDQYHIGRAHDLLMQIRSGNFFPLIGETEISFNGPSYFHDPMRIVYFSLANLLVPKSFNAVEVNHIIELALTVISYILVFVFSLRLMDKNKNPFWAMFLAVTVVTCPGIMSLLFVDTAYPAHTALPWAIAFTYYFYILLFQKPNYLNAVKAAISLAGTFFTHPVIAVWMGFCAMIGALLAFFVQRKFSVSRIKVFLIYSISFLLFSLHHIVFAFMSGGSYTNSKLTQRCNINVEASALAGQNVPYNFFKLLKLDNGSAYEHQPGYLFVFLFLILVYFSFKQKKSSLFYFLGITLLPVLTLFTGTYSYYVWRILPCEFSHITAVTVLRAFMPLAIALAFGFAAVLSLVKIKDKKIVYFILALLFLLNLQQAWVLRQRSFYNFGIDNPGQFIDSDRALSFAWANSGIETQEMPLDGRFYNSVLLESGERKLSNLTYLTNQCKNLKDLSPIPERDPKSISSFKFDQYVGKNIFVKVFETQSGCNLMEIIDSRRKFFVGTIENKPNFLSWKNVGENAEIIFKRVNNDLCRTNQTRLCVVKYNYEDFPIRINKFSPYRAEVENNIEGAFLETHRMYLKYYKAMVNGKSVQVSRSEEGNARVPLKLGLNNVELIIVSPFWYNLGWIFFLFSLCSLPIFHLIRRNNATHR